MENKYGFVYMTVNKIDGKKYIGKCIYSRKNNWESYLGSGLYLKRAIEKYGRDNFERIILAEALTADELNELEERIIVEHNAVESPDYYNLKLTSIGGDTFTYSSDQARTRRLKSENMSGQNNHQYGKQKTDAMLDAVRAKNSRAISIDDTEYKSISEASRLLGLGVTTISFRLDSLAFPNYKRLHDKKTVHKKDKSSKKKAFRVGDLRFESINEGAKYFNVSKYCVSNRLRSSNFPDWIYISEENL